MELWNFISLVWGYVTPILIEFLGKKVHGWGKVTLAILFALISGFIVATLENGLKIANIKKILGLPLLFLVLLKLLDCNLEENLDR